MILNKADLYRYIHADYQSQGMEHPFLARFSYGENWAMFKYMKTLRKLKYYKNAPPSKLRRLLFYWYFMIHRKQSLRYNIYISPNIVGEGFKLVHPGFRRIDNVVKCIG